MVGLMQVLALQEQPFQVVELAEQRVVLEPQFNLVELLVALAVVAVQVRLLVQQVLQESLE